MRAHGALYPRNLDRHPRIPAVQTLPFPRIRPARCAARRSTHQRTRATAKVLVIRISSPASEPGRAAPSATSWTRRRTIGYRPASQFTGRTLRGCAPLQGILTTKPNPNPKVADEDPWSDGITEYENQHDETYIRLLDADKEGVDKDEMARLILGIDPTKEPERARKAVESHLARAIWMTQVGYRHLAAGRYPGAERKQAEQADLIRPLGMARPSRCAATPSASPATLHNASGSDCPTPCARSTLRRRSMTRVPEHRRFESRRTLACSAKAFPVPDNSLTYNAFYFSTVEDEQDIAISKQTGIGDRLTD